MNDSLTLFSHTKMSHLVEIIECASYDDATPLPHAEGDDVTGETLTEETRSEEEEPTEEDKAFIDDSPSGEIEGAAEESTQAEESASNEPQVGEPEVEEHSASDDETDVEEDEEESAEAEGPSSSGAGAGAHSDKEVEEVDSDGDYVETDEDGHPLLNEDQYLHWATGFVQGVRRMRRQLTKLLPSGKNRPSLSKWIAEAAAAAFEDGDVVEAEYGPDLCLEGDDE